MVRPQHLITVRKFDRVVAWFATGEIGLKVGIDQILDRKAQNRCNGTFEFFNELPIIDSFNSVESLRPFLQLASLTYP